MEGSSIFGWAAIALGAGMVLTGIILMAYVARLMRVFISLRQDEPVEATASATAPVYIPAAPVPAPVSLKRTSEKARLTAAIAAVIAMHMGTEPSGLRIHAIRRLDA